MKKDVWGTKNEVAKCDIKFLKFFYFGILFRDNSSYKKFTEIFL